MCPNPQFPADMDTLTEEILIEKFQFLCSDMTPKYAIKLGIVDWDKFEMYPAENFLSEERIAKVNISNLAHPNQLIDYKVWHGSRDCHCARYSKILFNLGIQSTDKTLSVVKIVGRTLMKKCANARIKGNRYFQQRRYLWQLQESLFQWKRKWIEAASRYKNREWFK